MKEDPLKARAMLSDEGQKKKIKRKKGSNLPAYTSGNVISSFQHSKAQKYRTRRGTEGQWVTLIYTLSVFGSRTLREKIESKKPSPDGAFSQ